jgi:hypothetical protein
VNRKIQGIYIHILKLLGLELLDRVEVHLVYQVTVVSYIRFVSFFVYKLTSLLVTQADVVSHGGGCFLHILTRNRDTERYHVQLLSHGNQSEVVL